MYSAAFQRFTMGVAAGVQILVLVAFHIPWTGHWSGWVPVACLAWLVVCQVKIERTRRELDRLQEESRWALAQHFPDPVGAMAGMDYLDRLTREQREELRVWFTNPAHGSVHPDDLPPVVRGFLVAVAEPPREGA